MITRLSAAMDGQPRHQHRPPSAASNRTIARRPPAPFAAHRARHQRQLKAHLPRPHPTRYHRTDDHPIIIGGGHTSHIHQHNLIRRRSRGIAPSHHHGLTRPWNGSKTEKRRHQQIFLATGQRLGRNSEGRLATAQMFTEFKGCLRHSSKGDSRAER